MSLFLVTPSFHRSHHAQDLKHQNANYGITLTLWDRLFRTFQPPAINPQVGLSDVLTNDTMQSYFALVQLPWRERPPALVLLFQNWDCKRELIPGIGVKILQ